MQCVCCLNGSGDRKLTSFTLTLRRVFVELTRLELVQKSPQICSKCKSQLKSSSDFYRMCLRSHEQWESEAKEVPKPKRTRRVRKTVSEEHLDCTANDDSMPEIESQDDGVAKNGEILPMSPQTEDEHADAKPPTPKYLCNECGITFKTAQRLQVHSYTHSGIKNWKCSDCDKVFATKFRLNAHFSEFVTFETICC